MAWFDRFARKSAAAIGSPLAFLLTIVITALWLVLGWWLNWRDVWQLTYTTALTIATQLTVTLIRYAEEANSLALQAKLDALIYATPAAQNRLAGIETESPQAIQQVAAEQRDCAKE